MSGFKSSISTTNESNDSLSNDFLQGVSINDIICEPSSSLTSFPIRLSVMTLNLWGTNHWPARSEALSQMLLSLKPDILLVQEASNEVLEFIDPILSTHDRVRQDKHLGWSTECNIYWDKSLFSKADHGSDSWSLKEYPNRGLFWTRLKVVANPSVKLFIGNIHFPWTGCDTEINTGVNQRIASTYKVCESLRNLVRDECIILGGDFNDDYHPIRILNEEMGLVDVFESLDLPPPITHPVRPSDPREESRPNRTLDWITCGLPSYGRVIGAFVKKIRGGRFPPPSDHYPILAFFDLTPLK
jgi:hypothetical protein